MIRLISTFQRSLIIVNRWYNLIIIIEVKLLYRGHTVEKCLAKLYVQGLMRHANDTKLSVMAPTKCEKLFLKIVSLTVYSTIIKDMFYYYYYRIDLILRLYFTTMCHQTVVLSTSNKCMNGKLHSWRIFVYSFNRIHGSMISYAFNRTI